jgi:hypothetical protein
METFKRVKHGGLNGADSRSGECRNPWAGFKSKRAAPGPDPHLDVAAGGVDLHADSQVGTARWAVRAASSGAILGQTTSRSQGPRPVPPADARAGTTQRVVPTLPIHVPFNPPRSHLVAFGDSEEMRPFRDSFIELPFGHGSLPARTGRGTATIPHSMLRVKSRFIVNTGKRREPARSSRKLIERGADWTRGQ